MIDPTWWWHDNTTPPFWDDLQQAVYEDRLIGTTYENFEGDITERVLAPYSLICKSSLWYLVAERDQELRTYRVTRFRSVRLLDQSFSRRPDFDLPRLSPMRTIKAGKPYLSSWIPTYWRRCWSSAWLDLSKSLRRLSWRRKYWRKPAIY
jgi:predicted DNA-binding transcriptional regulator YafY